MERHEELKSFLKMNYEIDTIQSITILNGGYSSVYRVDCDAGCYVLKKTVRNGMNHPEREPAINRLLKDNGIPVSTFIRGKDGSYVYDDHGLACHLQTLEHGNPIKRNTAQDRLLLGCARLLGRIQGILGQEPDLLDGMDAAWCRGINSRDAGRFHSDSLPWAEACDNAEAAGLLQWKLSHIGDLDRMDINFGRLTRGNARRLSHLSTACR